MTTRNSNKLPAPGDAVLRYNYKEHSHENVPSGVIAFDEGRAVGGGYYVRLEDDTIISVENFDAKRKEWIEKRPHYTNTENLKRKDAVNEG